MERSQANQHRSLRESGAVTCNLSFTGSRRGADQNQGDVGQGKETTDRGEEKKQPTTQALLKEAGSNISCYRAITRKLAVSAAPSARTSLSQDQRSSFKNKIKALLFSPLPFVTRDAAASLGISNRAEPTLFRMS